MTNGRHDYSFRNKDFISTPLLSPTPNASGNAPCMIDDSWEIIIPSTYSRLVRYYTADLNRFFMEAFGFSLKMRRVHDITPYLNAPSHKIILTDESSVDTSPLTSDRAGAYHIAVTADSIVIIGKTERGTAQGVYHLEDMMRLRGDSRIPEENTEHAPLFSPRMNHSGIELDTFPDNYLEACAHSGMDAILVYAGHLDTNLHGFKDPDALWPNSGMGYCDFNNLVWRAEGYGLDVYIYSHFITDMHPDEPGAAEYYDASFGQLFKNCPGLKGIVFVGETFEFPSKDPHTSGIRCQLKPADDSRPSPGWYPCEDYPAFVTLVKDTIFKYCPQADVVFWTYNWGWAPKDARLALIENLPKDISLLVTFEMWEIFKDELGQDYRIDDYSICFPGPSQVFRDEAQKAKECGLRLYTMCNTGGRTWDVGNAPYMPVPQQWQKRYEALCNSHEEYGLCGLMESHHYGWLPSFLTLFSKNAFTTNTISNEEMLSCIARRDYGEYAAAALRAWQYFSDGICHMVASAVDQYGPYRPGPTYPLTFDQTASDLQIPSVPWALHEGADIWNPIYKEDRVWQNPENALLRYAHVQKLTDHFQQGCALLDEAVAKLNAPHGSEISCQAAVARYICCTYVTASNVMEWTIAKALLIAQKNGKCYGCEDALYTAIGLDNRTLAGLAERMETIAARETENVSQALACWEEDSSIGFEASMEYVFNRECAEWKNTETIRSLKRLREYLKEEI